MACKRASLRGKRIRLYPAKSRKVIPSLRWPSHRCRRSKRPKNFPTCLGKRRRKSVSKYQLPTMKSAYELAMERLNKTSPTVKLTDEQKKEIGELESKCSAKIAERELFIKGEIAKA